MELGPLGGTLEFLRKLSESRCPSDVECVRAGEATILVRFQPSSQSPALLSLMTPAGASGSTVVDTLGYRLSLEELRPYPSSDNPQPLGPSVATIQIDEKR